MYRPIEFEKRDETRLSLERDVSVKVMLTTES